MSIKKVLSIRKYKAGYEIRTELIDGEKVGCEDFEMKSAYTSDGHYIGNSKWAYRLCKTRGIKPELRTPSCSVCSIGFCEREQKWYGWSHRAIYGFGIGSRCEKGNCHYKPASFDAIRAGCNYREYDCIAKEYGCTASVTVALEPIDLDEPEGSQRAVEGSEEGRCKCSEENCVYELGRGEWVAKTVEDAKQMAKDFASGVS